MRNELAEIEICCRGLIAETSGLLTWEWDDYIGTFLAAFGGEKTPAVSALCDKYFMSQWDVNSRSKMPPSIMAISDSLGGLRSSQILFVTRPGDFVIAYGAWWPWGDEKTISLRIGLVTSNVPAFDGEKLFREFSEWFTNPHAAETTVS